MVSLPFTLSRPEALRTAVLTGSHTMPRHTRNRSVIVEMWALLRAERKYWLAPIVITFVLLGLLLLFAQSSALAPFIYTLF